MTDGNAIGPRMGILDEMTMDEVRDFQPEVVVLPVGSTEPHGYHLPYCTDAIRVRTTCEEATVRANAKGARVLCYPTLPIGMNVNFQAFPFALGVRLETFLHTLRDLCEQIEAHGVRKISIINGHGGNTQALGAFLRQWAERGVGGMPGAEDRAFVCAGHARSRSNEDIVRHPSNHAGEAETLEVMAVAPHLVRMEKARDYPSRRAIVDGLEGPGAVWVKPWHRFLPDCAQGEAREADPERAARLFDLNAQSLADFLIELSAAPWSADFPYAPQA